VKNHLPIAHMVGCHGQRGRHVTPTDARKRHAASSSHVALILLMDASPGISLAMRTPCALQVFAPGISAVSREDALTLQDVQMAGSSNQEM
jgi:hypothetical protein